MKLPALVPDVSDPAAIARSALAHEPAPLTEVAAFLGAPAVELEANTVSARIAVAAANEGRCFVHHEHRLSPLLPEAARPEIDVGMGEDELLPEDWREGVLHVPKYFSAFLEAPLPVFNPSHRSKWRPHELLHKLARHAWRPDLTRFEAYLTARLSELLPVVHWYGFDEVGRHACPEHRGRRPDRTHCVRCERSLVSHWAWNADMGHAEQAAAHALEHLRTELDACARELASGRAIATPRPGLDASSDAIGYLRGHWNRITAWSFGAWIERFSAAGRDHFESCADHLDHVRSLANTLLTAPFVLAPLEQREAARDRHTAADLAYRVLLHIETFDTDAAEDTLMPVVDALASGQRPDAVLGDLAQRLRALDPATAERTLAGGWSWLPSTPGTRTSLRAGLRTALPRALAGFADDVLDGFAEHDRTPSPTSLAHRGAAYLATQGHPASATAALEAWLRDAPAADLEAERFGALPDAATTEGTTRLNHTFRRMQTPAAALDAALGEPSSREGDVTVCAIRWAGQPRVLEEDDELRAALDAADAGSLRTDEVTETLLERGFIVWLPPVR